MRPLNVAVVGATGLVGAALCQVLAERRLPIRRLLPLCSPRRAGSCISFAGQQLTAQAAEPHSFAGIDLVLMSAGSAVSAQLAPAAAAAGAVVVDNSACFRGAPQVPLVVPEVNAAHLADWRLRRIVANPNCSTIQLVVALSPLHRAFAAQRLVLSTYQAVSGAGRAGLAGLASGAADACYGHPIAGNCVPQIGELDAASGNSGEERKMIQETRKILAAPQLQISATCVRVPVEVGHSVAVHVRFARPFDLPRARQLLRQAPGVVLCGGGDGEPHFATARQAAGGDATYVGRLRATEDPHEATFFCVADNLRKGAATNAVQVAELLAPLL